MINRFEPHSHTHFSNIRILDAINRPSTLVAYAHEIGLKGISITDHECLSASVEINRLQKEWEEKDKDFKIAIGNEIYLTDDRSKGQKYYHHILIAKDCEGHRQLRQMSSESWLQSYYDRGLERVPTTREELAAIVKRNPGHLVATTACIGGVLGQNILSMTKARTVGNKNDEALSYNEIIRYLEYLKDVFGEDAYIEIAPAANQEQIIVNQKLVEIANFYNMKVVIGCDAHYLKKEDRYIHEAFLNSKGGEREVASFYEYAYLQTEEEIVNNITKSGLQGLYETFCKNSMEIYDKIEHYDLSHPQTIPHVPVTDYPKEDKNIEGCPVISAMFMSDDKSNRAWVHETVAALQKRGLWDKKEYQQRLEFEADIKKTVGDSLGTNIFNYPLVLKYYIDMMWDEGSTIGAGRGSSAGGLNHWLLGITQYDPIKWELPFERYMNKDTVGLPDIDIDICPSKRPRIMKKIKAERAKRFEDGISYIAKQHLGCTMVATFGTASSKRAIQIACFKEGTLVQTKFGEKEIQDLIAGEEVWTINGWEKIIQPTQRKWNQNFVQLDGNYGFEDEIICTDTHQFLILPKTNQHRLDGEINKDVINRLVLNYTDLTQNQRKKYNNYIRNIEPIWVEAKDLKEKDYLLTRIDTKIEDVEKFSQNWGDRGNVISKDIFVNNLFCEWLGIWLAEGSINQSYIAFTISNEEEKLKDRIIYLTENIFGLYNAKIYERNENHTYVIKIDSAPLRNFMLWLYNANDVDEINQWNKRVPEKLKYIHPQKQLQIFKGWVMGDGYARTRTGSVWSGSVEAKGTTVSKQLALDMKFILHRNYINPSFCKNKPYNKKPFYDLILSGDIAKKIYEIKYNDFEKELIIDWEDRLGKDLPCVYQGNLYMRSQIKTKKIIINTEEKDVYCLMVPSETFSVSGIIVHNCKGYRSAEYPDGIDSDTSQYLSSLVSQERGFVYSISDTYYGNEEKNRAPSTIFKHEIDQYPKLLEIILGVEGLIVSRSSHASGVIMNDEDPYKFGCYMKTPVGEVITQYNLGDCEATGATKYDFLVTSVQDKLCETIKMLQNDGEIECDMSLREVYDKYFNPEIIPFDDQETWESICGGKILDLFQFDSPVGAQGIKAIQPKNLRELSDTNGLIRLMAEEGKERPLDKYVRFKANPTLWYYEMEKTGLVKKDYPALERHLKKSNGVCISQEAIMWSLMDEDICGFSLKEANAARKVISKKKMDKLAALKEQIYEKATSEAMGKYVWEYIVLPSAGYGFSDLHALSYSMVGYQTAYIATKWNPIYWNTACLIVNSGSLDEDSSDIVEDEDGNGVVLSENDKESAVNYDKLAKAIGKVIEQGIKISLVDINKSENIFAPNADTGEILFGMKALSHIGNEIIAKIVENRPYISLKDFMQKCPLTKVPMVNLIKAGAFDKLMNVEGVEPRTAAMIYYLWEVCDKKKRLTLQNLNGLIEKDLIPKKEFKKEIEIFKINKILKKNKKDIYYLVPDAAAIDRVVDVDYEIVDAAAAIPQTTWDAIYKKATAKIKPYIQQHHDELLEKVNQLAFMEMWDKYGKGNLSSWEMEAMCFYYHPHELEGIDEDRYGIVNFKTLSPDSEADYFFKRNGRQIPIFKLSRIAGTVISKDNVRHTISLLTSHGVVNVKFTKDYYAMCQRQISELQVDGTKKIKEKSWFTRGTMLVITGYKRGDDFVAKRYSKTPGHTIYKIVQVNGDKLILTSQRYGQEGEGNVEDIGK